MSTSTFRRNGPTGREPGRVTSSLASLAGMRESLIAQFSGDRKVFVATAWMLFATTVEAALSGGFAISRAFSDSEGNSLVPIWGLILFALVWGGIIFTLDRFLVLGLEAIHGWRALVLVLFRAALALVLGLVMATPLVIAVFSSDIQAELGVIQGEQVGELRALEADARATYDELRMKEGEAEQAYTAALATKTPDPLSDPTYIAARAKEDASRQLLATADYKAAQEANGTLPPPEGSGGAGDGRQYRALADEAERLRASWLVDKAAADSAYAAANTVPANADAIIEQRLADWNSAKAAAAAADEVYMQYSANTLDAEESMAPGLLTSLTALEHLMNGRPATEELPARPGNSQVLLAHWGIVALLVIIELSPVLIKGTKQALRGWGADKDYLTEYEQACKDQDEEARNRVSQWESDASKAWRAESSLQTVNAKDMATRQSKLQAEMNDEVVNTQRVMMRRALSQWRREQAQRWGDQDLADLEAEIAEEREREGARSDESRPGTPVPPAPTQDAPPAPEPDDFGDPISTTTRSE